MKKTVQSQDDQTIIAQSTPQGSGALALIRLTGNQAIEIANNFCVIGKLKKLIEQRSHTIHYGTIVDRNNNTIDKALISLMRGPNTFTGQDTIEFSCHNNVFIIQAIIDEALFYGARMAQEGEFTRRAFTHGKIDLIQAEAINDLIKNTNSPLAIKKSLAHIDGSLSQIITTLEKKTLHALAFTQASFEFIDEEDISFDNEIRSLIEENLIAIATVKNNYPQQQLIRNGIRIALIGSVNAGKSSLFNSLLRQERSIVTSIAGTTRDSIEAGVYRQGIYVTFIDTAGLRKTNDTIEKIGIERSLEQAQLADIILLVIDGSRHVTEQEKKLYDSLLNKHFAKIILIINKIDLPIIINYLSKNIEKVECSSQTAAGITQLEKAIHNKVQKLMNNNDLPYLLNVRQFNLLTTLEQEFSKVLMLLKNRYQHELISVHLEEALSLSTQLTGKTISEQAMDAIFKEFCVGK